MNKTQAINFWAELHNSTEVAAVITRFKNRTGYGGPRTLERYAQADRAFRQGFDMEELSTNTGWKKPYLEKLLGWWAKWQQSNRTAAEETTERPNGSDEESLRSFIRDNFLTVSAAAEGFKQYMRSRIEAVQITRGDRATATIPTHPFCTEQVDIIKEIRRRDALLNQLEGSFWEALESSNIPEAEKRGQQIGQRLDEWVRI